MDRDRTFKIGVNPTIIDKPKFDGSLNPAKNWQNLDLTADELAQHIKLGHAFSAHFRESHRKTQNFICSGFAAADIDGTLSIDEALEFSFVRDFAAILYTTPSHTNEKNRFRVVFLL